MSAAAVFPDSTHGTVVGSAGGATGSAGGAGQRGGDSMMTCALVPLTPKEETAARRGRSAAVQESSAVSSATVPVEKSRCGEGSSACRVRGSNSYSSACTILMTPATPAAVWVWPMLDLIEPSRNGRSRSDP